MSDVPGLEDWQLRIKVDKCTTMAFCVRVAARLLNSLQPEHAACSTSGGKNAKSWCNHTMEQLWQGVLHATIQDSYLEVFNVDTAHIFVEIVLGRDEVDNLIDEVTVLSQTTHELRIILELHHGTTRSRVEAVRE